MPPQRDVYQDFIHEFERRIQNLEDDLADLLNRFWRQRGEGGGLGGLRMVWGAIYNDTDPIVSGSGDWTVDYPPLGDSFNVYTIHFDPFPSSDIVVSLTPNNNNPANDEGRYQVSLVSRQADYIEARTDDIDDPDLLTQDGGFDFIIIGATS